MPIWLSSQTVWDRWMTNKDSLRFWYNLIKVNTILLFITGHGSIWAAPVEAWYQNVWCRGMKGEVEVRMEDGRRIDCLTDTHAIEIEFARKWSEAVGQALDYSMLTSKQAGIVLVLKHAQDETYWQRLKALVNHYRLPIRLWRLGP